MNGVNSPNFKQNLQQLTNQQEEEDNQQVKRDEVKRKSFTSVQGYTLHEILGKGSFGQVFKATKNNKVYAIKMIDKPLIRKKNLQKYVNNEVKVMRELKNQNTVRLYEAFEDKDILYLVMEYCNQGTLFNYILKNKPEETECVRIFVQILKGFIEIHEKHILHRDLKPSNIFIKDGIFKIADFGLAKPKALGSSYCGTSYFMAPEILQKKVHDYKVDLWSMGVILFFMIFREYPFKNSAKLLDEIQQKTNPHFDPYKCLKHPKNTQCSANLLELFKRIFVIDPAKRISFKELYDTDLFSGYFSANELRHSSRIYQDLEKKPPQNQENEENNDDDDDDEEEHPKEDMNKTKTSRFKPSKASEAQFQSLNNIQTEAGQQTSSKNTINQQIGAAVTTQYVNGDSDNKLSQQMISLDNQNQKTNQNSQSNNMNKSIRTNLTFEYKEVKINMSTHQIQIQSNDSRFDHDELEINNDESPQIQLKNIKMQANNHQFGPKAFQELYTLPNSKTKNYDEMDSIPNAPSSFQINNLSHNSLQNFAQQMENGNGNTNTGQQFSSSKSVQIQSKYGKTKENVAEENEDEEQSVGEKKQDENESQPISFPEKEDFSNDSNMKKMPIRKAPSMHMNMVDQAVKDKLRKQIIEECEQVFESHAQIYLYEIGIYSILGDTVDSLNVLNLGSSTQSLINYLLSKLLLFFATNLYNSLQNVTNIFNLQYFNQFASSPTSQLLKGKITRDIEQWSMKFSLFYYGIDYEQDIQSAEVRKVVTEDLIETDFDTQLKIPIRLVLDLIFKASYKMGRTCTNPLQSSAILRTSLYILLSMLINNIFDKNKVKDYLIYYFQDPKNAGSTQIDFVNFSLWTAQASKEALLDQIHHLIKVFFGEKKLQILKTRL
ncbi:hypothetical protein ABPG74_009463 [Tetrahymena malaccensis]